MPLLHNYIVQVLNISVLSIELETNREKEKGNDLLKTLR